MSHFLIAAGGTGGHMVPAHAVSEELKRRGHQTSLVTDARGAAIPNIFAGDDKHVIDAASIGGNPLRWIPALLKIWKGRRQASAVVAAHAPVCAVGFGGYPVLPAMMAALKGSVPTLICEQNAVLGRVNRLLAKRVDAVALSFPETERLPDGADAQVTGNPVRQRIVAIGKRPYPPVDDICPLRILIMGGSLGASILARVVPQALARLPEPLKRRLQVVQQAREEDFEAVCTAYSDAEIPADVRTYVDDVAQALADCHLFIGRAGASTISELTAAGRPGIFVPLPIATDDHQAANTREMVKAGAAAMIRQQAFTPENLARQVTQMLERPETLANAAARANAVGRPDAASRVADMAERLAGVGGQPQIHEENSV